MGKFEKLEVDIYSVFGSLEWQAENIETYPNNIVPSGVGSEFITVTIVPSGSALNLLSVSGQIIIDIYTAAGSGVRRASILADKLDQYLVGKSLTTGDGTTLCKASSLAHFGALKENPSMFHTTYTITFTYFGV